MSALGLRGYQARVFTGTADTTGSKLGKIQATGRIVVANEGANELRLWTSEAAYDEAGNVEFWPIAAGTTFREEIEIDQLLLRAGAGTTAYRVMVLYAR